MKTKLLITLILSSSFLAGCDVPTKEEVKTVDYYQQNKNERDQKIKECSNNPAELKSTPNCINASQALTQDSSGKVIRGSW